MGAVNGSGLVLTRQAAAAMGKALEGASEDKVFRVKQDGSKYQFLSDQGAKGNLKGRTIRPGQLQEKQANNLAAGYLAAKLYAQEGSSGASIDPERLEETTALFKKSLAERNIQMQVGMTASVAKGLYAEGQAKDAVRDLPHASGKQIAGNIDKYLAQKDFGAKILSEHLSTLDFSVKENADGLRDITVGSHNHKLSAFPKVQQALVDKWIDVRSDSIAQVDKPLHEKLQAGESRLKSFKFRSSEQSPSEPVNTSIAQKVIAQVVISAAHKSDATAIEYDFEAATAGDPELAANTIFQASYYQFMAQAIADGELSNSNISSQSGSYDDIQPQIKEAALEAAGLKSQTDKGNISTANAIRSEPKTKVTSDNNNQLRFENLKKLTEKLTQSIKTMTVKEPRFSNVPSPAKTNVPLRVTDPETGHTRASTGEIHANFVPVSGKKTAIATQYPMNTDTAKASFWRMAAQQSTDLIVDLTQPADGLKGYYPTEVGQTVSYNGVNVTLNSAENNYFNYAIEDTATGENAQVKRFNADYWKDKTALSTEDLSSLAVFVGNDQFENVTVHCKAGIGRTSTIFIATALLNMMRNGEIEKEDIDDTVDRLIMDMRAARGPNALQTPPQREVLVKLMKQWFEKGTP